MFAIIHHGFTILAEGGAVLEFFVNGYKIFLFIFFDIRIVVFQGVVQMKN